MFALFFPQGGHVSGFRGVHSHDTYHPNEPVMFHVKGDKPEQTRAIQVGVDKGLSFSKQHNFLLKTAMQVYLQVEKTSC